MTSDTYGELLDILRRIGLTPKENAAIIPLVGGVSCEIFRVELADGPVCVKRALPKLRVAIDWHAPVERADSEVKWLKLAESLGRPLAPRVIAQSASDHLFVMEYLEPDIYPNWKSELAAGRIDLNVAARVGHDLARFHANTAYRRDIADTFTTDALFSALRLDPYLRYTGARHPGHAERLNALASNMQKARVALVHGDVSPKNILIGPDGPVFLDAECAWYGDPAFDLAFCLTHLLLKCVWRPAWHDAYLAAFDALAGAYMSEVEWEPAEALDLRAGALLSALLLARVDGKSPVEYLVAPEDKAFVRESALALLAHDEIGATEVARRWAIQWKTR